MSLQVLKIYLYPEDTSFDNVKVLETPSVQSYEKAAKPLGQVILRHVP